jgi:FdhD protein
MKVILPDDGLLTHQNTPRLRQTPESVGAEGDSALLVEHLLEVYLNEVLTFRLVCSPTMLPELVLGRLLTEGMIHAPAEVKLIHLCSKGLEARVYLDKAAPETDGPMVETVASCCTGNRTLSDLFADGSRPHDLSPIPYEPDWIYKLSAAINQNTPIYAATHSAHSCILMHQGEILVCAEDIGRHNAMDKVIGWALLHEIPLAQCILYTSGRVPVDMTMKAIRAGVPILASKALPTDKAVELAQEFHLTLIGGAHPDCFQVFHREDSAIQ